MENMVVPMPEEGGIFFYLDWCFLDEGGMCRLQFSVSQ
jgi:hypothetical protein